MLVLLPGNAAPQQDQPVPQDAATSQGTKKNYWVLLNRRKNNREHSEDSYINYPGKECLKEKVLLQVVLASRRKRLPDLLQ